MKFFHRFGRVALILAAGLVFTTPARAQEVGPEETVAYQTWYGANAQSMQEKAIESAQDYLAKFPAGKYAPYLKNWLLAPRIQAFGAAAQAKNTDEMIKVGREILKQDPENLSIQYRIAFNLRAIEFAASPASFVHAKEAIEFSTSAIKLIEAGKVVEGVKKETTLAILYLVQALVAADAKNTSEAIALYTKSSASDPLNVGIVANNLLALASLNRVGYDAAVKAYQVFPEADRQSATPSPEVQAARDALYASADPLIDSWARFVALARARGVAAETRDQVLASLKTVYTTRYAGDTSGLEPLLEKLQAEYTPKP